MKVDPLTPTIGAVLSGPDLTQPLSDVQLEVIYQALIDHLVIFFRDQEISPKNLIEFASHFGELDEPHLVYGKVEGFPNVVEFKNDAAAPPDTNAWHTDLTFKPEPAFASILTAKEVPQSGGDTLWSSLYAAYDGLPDPMKDYVGTLRAIHDMGDFRNFYTVNESSGDRLTAAMGEFGCAIHPVVKRHPITGRPFLYINESFTRHIVGLTIRESDRLLQYLLDHMKQPEYQVRFRWRKNSVAMWDNRVTMHYAVADYTEFRRMQRVTVVRDKRDQADAELS